MKYIFMLFLTGCACTGVIGAVYDKNNVVVYTYNGSPAEEAGVVKGDKLINPKDIPGKSKEPVTFEFIREDKMYKKTVVRKCLKEIRKWKK